MPIILPEAVTNNLLRNSEYRSRILCMADRLLELDLANMEEAAPISEIDLPLAEIALRLASSKRAMVELSGGIRIGFIFAMWREARRLQPQAPGNPTGENCLVDKLEILEWLFRGSNAKWTLYAIDDDCPENSAGIAERIALEHHLGHHVRIHSLRQEFPFPDAPLSFLKDPSQSIKGGAILLGCKTALSDGCDIVAYTDADNSTHVGQFGSLLGPIARGDADVMVGDRWEGNPFGWWNPKRGTEQPGARVLNHLRGLLAMEPPTRDVFSPFKAFKASSLLAALPQIERFDFCFDLDLVCAASAMGAQFGSVNVLSFDSFDETTWVHHGDAEVWFQKLAGMVSAASRFDIPHNPEVAGLISAHINGRQQITRLCESNPPSALISCDRDELGDERVLSVADTSSFVRRTLHAEAG